MAEPVEQIRSAVIKAIQEHGPQDVAQAVGISAQSLTDFSTAIVHQPRAKNWFLIQQWYERQQTVTPQSDEFAAGVLYAAEKMSQTVADLLREQRTKGQKKKK